MKNIKKEKREEIKILVGIDILDVKQLIQKYKLICPQCQRQYQQFGVQDTRKYWSKQ